MFTELLYPTDFSETCKEAFPYMNQPKGAGTKEAIALHVIDEGGIKAFARAPEGSRHLQEQTENAARSEFGRHRK